MGRGMHDFLITLKLPPIFLVLENLKWIIIEHENNQNPHSPAPPKKDKYQAR